MWVRKHEQRIPLLGELNRAICGPLGTLSSGRLAGVLKMRHQDKSRANARQPERAGSDVEKQPSQERPALSKAWTTLAGGAGVSRARWAWSSCSRTPKPFAS